jgi:hypothetical protein
MPTPGSLKNIDQFASNKTKSSATAHTTTLQVILNLDAIPSAEKELPSFDYKEASDYKILE